MNVRIYLLPFRQAITLRARAEHFREQNGLPVFFSEYLLRKKILPQKEQVASISSSPCRLRHLALHALQQNRWLGVPEKTLPHWSQTWEVF